MFYQYLRTDKLGEIVKNLFFITLLFLASSAFAASKNEIVNVNLEWFAKNNAYIEIALQDNERQAVPVVNTLGQIWLHKDGAVASEVAPFIAKALMLQPTLMLSWFQTYPNTLVEFNEGMQYHLYTDYTGTKQQKIEDFKKVFESSLQSFQSKEKSELTAIANRILQASQKLQVRVVD